MEFFFTFCYQFSMIIIQKKNRSIYFVMQIDWMIEEIFGIKNESIFRNSLTTFLI